MATDSLYGFEVHSVRRSMLPLVVFFSDGYFYHDIKVRKKVDKASRKYGMNQG